MMMKKYILPALCFFLFVAKAFGQQDITLEDIWAKGTFRSASFNGFQGLKNGLRYAKLINGRLMSCPYVSLNISDTPILIADFNKLAFEGKLLRVEDYSLSDDEEVVLLTTETEQIYRHSSKAIYYVLYLKTGQVRRVYEQKVMYATLSPNAEQVAFVFENNLFVQNLTSGKVRQVTKDGKQGSVINGAVDWVYEEEFSMSRGFEWSPDGNSIAYYCFDETHVKEFGMDVYGELYPEREQWKYPKAGEDNARVDVWVYNMENLKSVQCETGSEKDQYLPRIKWTTNPSLLSVQRLNRTQNHWELLFFDAITGKGTVVLEELSNTYIDISDDLYFLNNGHQFLFTSDLSGYNHIWMYDTKSGKRKAITGGNWDVETLSAVDESKGIVYYTSYQNSPLEQHFYSIGLDGKKARCLTPEPGNHSITLLPGNKYFVDGHSSFNNPERISLISLPDLKNQVLEENKKLKEVLATYRLGGTRFGSMKLSGETKLNYWMILPPDFDSTKKYPMLMHVYGGPGANTVNNRWSGSNYLWHQMLAQKGYIVVSVDNRGTGHQGSSFKKSTYLQLGKLEQEDQAAAAGWFSSQMKFVDGSRIGIWGWSFGGYLSSLCLSKSPEVFKMAIAVAPVTNWRFYDNIYTERYLRKPQDNKAGYEENSPLNFVSGIRGKYLIVHGTADDNVHFQNTAEMIKAMIDANVDFDSEIYPDKNHGIYGGYSRLHLYRRMTKFIEENL